MNQSQEPKSQEQVPIPEENNELQSFEQVLEAHQKGVKHLEESETLEAIDMLSKALEAGCKQRGEMDPSLKVFYLDYGRALLQKISESSADVLAPIFDKDEGESDNSPRSQVYDKNSPRIETCNQEEEKEEQKQGEEEKEETKQNGINKEEEPLNQSKEKEQPKQEKRNISDPEVSKISSQAAWELLELARVLGDRELKENETRVNILFQADVHMRLGDLEMLRENLDKAMQEYQLSLELRKKVEDEKYSRLLAETYFMLGQLVSQISQRVDQAPQYMEQARDILLNCLKKEMSVEEISNMQEFLITRQDDLAEVKNLKETISDLNAKMMEMKEDKPAIPQEIKQILRNEFSQLVSGFTELTQDQKGKVNDLGKILTKKQKEKMAQRLEETKEKENKPERAPEKSTIRPESEGKGRAKMDESGVRILK